MIRILKISLLFAGIMLPLCSVAQKDFGVWIGGDLRIPVTKKIDLGLQLESRFENNVSSVDQSFISPYVKYEFHKYVGIGVAYRLSNKPSSGFLGGNTYHRIGIDFNFKKLENLIVEKSRLELDARIRFTHASQGGDLNNDYFRTRFKLGYNLPKTKLKPVISAELFFHFNDQLTYTSTDVITTHRFNKYRINLELEYKINKRHELNLYYIIQPTIESPNTSFILGLGYKYELKLKK